MHAVPGTGLDAQDPELEKIPRLLKICSSFANFTAQRSQLHESYRKEPGTGLQEICELSQTLNATHYLYVGFSGKRVRNFHWILKAFVIKTCLRTMASEITAKILDDPPRVVYRGDLPPCSVSVRYLH